MHKTYFNVDTLTWVFKSAGPPYVNIKVATFVDKIKMPMHHLTLNWLWCLYMDLWLFVGVQALAIITWRAWIIQLARFELMDDIWCASETLALPPSQK